MATNISESGLDRAFKALRSHERRQLLVHLAADNRRTETKLVDDLDFPRSEDGVSVRLYHVHLPMLADLDFVDWDRETSQIERGPAFDEIRPLLEQVSEHDSEPCDAR